MTDTKNSKMKRSVPIGDVGRALYARRQEMGIDLARVEADTKIRGRFLMTLESGDYAGLPNDVYSRGFVQHYANYLGLDGAQMAADYVAERGGLSSASTQRRQFDRPKRVISTGPILAVATAIAAVIGLVGYILIQMSALAAPPRLQIDSPVADSIVAGSETTVKGSTTPGSDVSINESPIYIDNDGAFSEKVSLQEGVNAIQIKSTSKLGKSTIVTRNVLARFSQVESAAVSVPAAKFSGVAVAVKVKLATEIIVKADGQEVFRGLLLSGKSRLFSAASTIELTTSNAGATSLDVTNSQVVSKHFDRMGGDGEVRSGIIFAKDTVVQ